MSLELWGLMVVSNVTVHSKKDHLPIWVKKEWDRRLRGAEPANILIYSLMQHFW